jgi:7-carboxy-7-deazaguanine synthase
MAGDLLRVSELFYSIQGESTAAGLPCAFVRLCGCPLRCRYCDSSYTWEEEGRHLSVAEVCHWLARFPLVEITGGEPLAQEAVYPLMNSLLAQGHQVLLETSGCLSIAPVPGPVQIILDMKCPDSGMQAHNHWENLDLLHQRQATGSRDEVKFVLSSEEDCVWAMQVVRQYKLTERLVVLFSPVRDRLAPARLAEFILAAHLPIRLQMQLHTQIWPEQPRGV